MKLEFAESFVLCMAGLVGGVLSIWLNELAHIPSVLGFLWFGIGFEILVFVMAFTIGYYKKK